MYLCTCTPNEFSPIDIIRILFSKLLVYWMIIYITMKISFISIQFILKIFLYPC